MTSAFFFLVWPGSCTERQNRADFRKAGMGRQLPPSSSEYVLCAFVVRLFVCFVLRVLVSWRATTSSERR